MKRYSFLHWLELKEAVRTHLGFMPNDDDDYFSYRTAGASPKFGDIAKGEKDAVGIPTLQKPGFRGADERLIYKSYQTLEKQLTSITDKLGLHFVVSYIPPGDDVTQTNNAPSVRAAKDQGAAGWDIYSKASRGEAENLLQKFAQENPDANPPVSAENTIVYIKPTSRVHGLDLWQQGHNIGHAIWGYAKRKGGSYLKTVFIKKMRDIMYDLMQKHYAPGLTKPTAKEMTILLCRMLNIATCRRIFQAQTPDKSKQNFGSPAFKVMTAFNSFDELMFDIIGAYINNHGSFLPSPDMNKNRRMMEPYDPMGARQKERVPNAWSDAPSRKKMEPNPEIMRWAGSRQGGKDPTDVRPYTWEEMPIGQEEWEKAVRMLEEIIEEAFKSCTWASVGGPIYATHGYVTTGA